MNEDVEDKEGYQHLWNLTENWSKDRFKLYDQYKGNGENENDASEMTEERIRPYKEKNFFDRYQ